MTTREIVRQMISDNPNVTRAAMATRTGVSRERIRQVLLTEGLSVPRSGAYSGPWCKPCGNRIQDKKGRGTCNPCYRLAHPPVEFTCETCLKPFTVPQHVLRSMLQQNHPRPRFCTNTCWGSFTGNNYGFKAHPENALLSNTNREKTHCKWGHPFDEANTYRSPGNPNHRACRVCTNRRHAEARRGKNSS